MGCRRDHISAVCGNESMLVRNIRGAKNRVAFTCTELIGLSTEKFIGLVMWLPLITRMNLIWWCDMGERWAVRDGWGMGEGLSGCMLGLSDSADCFTLTTPFQHVPSPSYPMPHCPCCSRKCKTSTCLLQHMNHPSSKCIKFFEELI